MVFQLINKNTNEVIDSVDLSNVGKEGAKTFFRERKKLPQDEFDKLFIVKDKAFIGRYQWWEEESTKLDDF
jgi:hypothetical protein